MGSVKVFAPSGEAYLSFSVKGPKDQGRMFFMAGKRLGEWILLDLVVLLKGHGSRIVLIQDGVNVS
jgi:hypothetical protein